MKKIPIGIQAFSSLIEGDFIYLDKTDIIYKIAAVVDMESGMFLAMYRAAFQLEPGKAEGALPRMLDKCFPRTATALARRIDSKPFSIFYRSISHNGYKNTKQRTCHG